MEPIKNNKELLATLLVESKMASKIGTKSINDGEAAALDIFYT